MSIYVSGGMQVDFATCGTVLTIHSDYGEPVQFWCELFPGHEGDHKVTEQHENGSVYSIAWRPE